MIPGFSPERIAGAGRPMTIGTVPSGVEPLILAELARKGGPLAYVLSDGQRISDLEQMLGFVAPDIPVLTLPGWDCLPYDRTRAGPGCAAPRGGRAPRFPRAGSRRSPR